MTNLNLNGKPPVYEPDAKRMNRSAPRMLISEISRMMNDRIQQRSSDTPALQKSARLLLMELARKDGRTQLDLVKATHLKAPTISVVLQKLEKEGYVTKRPDEYDLRATRVTLTEKGRALDEQMRKTIYEEDEVAMSNLTDSERETLVRLLSKVRNTLLESNKEERDFF